MRKVILSEDTKKDILENLLKRSPNSYGKFEASVAAILADVKEKGDEAVFDYTKRFDGADINAVNIVVRLMRRIRLLMSSLWRLSEKPLSTSANTTLSRSSIAGLTQHLTERY